MVCGSRLGSGGVVGGLVFIPCRFLGSNLLGSSRKASTHADRDAGSGFVLSWLTASLQASMNACTEIEDTVKRIGIERSMEGVMPRAAPRVNLSALGF